MQHEMGAHVSGLLAPVAYLRPLAGHPAGSALP
jgi:hypothetical protein